MLVASLFLRLSVPAVLVALACPNAGMAADVEPPKRKSGLWEIRLSTAGAEGRQAMQHCIDEKTDDLMKNGMAGIEKQACSKNELKRDGDKLVAESVCTFSGSTATTKAIFSGKFDSAYKVDIQASYDPPMHGMKESATTIDARWLGPCLPGQKPGDMTMPGMPKINMGQIMKEQQKRK